MNFPCVWSQPKWLESYPLPPPPRKNCVRYVFFVGFAICFLVFVIWAYISRVCTATTVTEHLSKRQAFCGAKWGDAKKQTKNKNKNKTKILTVTKLNKKRCQTNTRTRNDDERAFHTEFWVFRGGRDGMQAYNTKVQCTVGQ